MYSRDSLGMAPELSKNRSVAEVKQFHHTLLTPCQQKSTIMTKPCTVGSLFEPGDGSPHLVSGTTVDLHLGKERRRRRIARKKRKRMRCHQLTLDPLVTA